MHDPQTYVVSFGIYDGVDESGGIANFGKSVVRVNGEVGQVTEALVLHHLETQTERHVNVIDIVFTLLPKVFHLVVISVKVFFVSASSDWDCQTIETQNSIARECVRDGGLTLKRWFCL